VRFEYSFFEASLSDGGARRGRQGVVVGYGAQAVNRRKSMRRIEACRMRFVLEIGNRAIAIIDAPNMDLPAPSLARRILWDILEDTLSAGVPLWDGRSPRTARAATDEEDLKWLAEHYRNNTELGFRPYVRVAQAARLTT
jgi:hypothetical protein